MASAPPSACPSHRLTVGMSTPASMHRVAANLNFATEDNLVLRLFHFSFPLTFTRA
jgi:hypothetical protein